MNAVRKEVVTRIKKSKTEAPQSLPEADTYIAKIGTAQSVIDAAVKVYEEKVAKLAEELAKAVEPQKEKRSELLSGLFAYAHAHKKALTVESKTVSLPSGKFLWRLTPPAVACDNDAALIAKFKKRGKTKYVRVVEELDREAMLADRAKLRAFGVHFTQREEFVVVPKNVDPKSEVKKTRTIDVDQKD